MAGDDLLAVDSGDEIDEVAGRLGRLGRRRDRDRAQERIAFREQGLTVEGDVG